jgi:hypothetical protein
MPIVVIEQQMKTKRIAFLISVVTAISRVAAAKSGNCPLVMSMVVLLFRLHRLELGVLRRNTSFLPPRPVAQRVIHEAPKQGRAFMQPGAAPAISFRFEVEIVTGLGAVAGTAAIPGALLGVGRSTHGPSFKRKVNNTLSVRINLLNGQTSVLGKRQVDRLLRNFLLAQDPGCAHSPA